MALQPDQRPAIMVVLRRRLAFGPPPRTRALPWALALLALSLPVWGWPAAWGKDSNKTMCCRTSGGTRGTCLNLWAHLVPPGNRVHPGASRVIALLQGVSPTPTEITVRFSTLAGDLVGEQTLPARGVGVRLLTLPAADRPPLNQPLIWESFPTCQPNKPPTRSAMVVVPDPGLSDSQRRLVALRQSCGGTVAAAPLLRALELDDFSAKLPPTLPVHCHTLTLDSLGIRGDQGNGSTP
jgi:hypothetical protein